MRAICTNPQFYIVLVSATKDREVARRAIRGPFTRQEFQTELKRICGYDLPQFDANVTIASTW